MKEWNSETGLYQDAVEQGDDEEKDVLKLKAKGAPARQLANMLLRKTKKKGNPNGPA